MAEGAAATSQRISDSANAARNQPYGNGRSASPSPGSNAVGNSGWNVRNLDDIAPVSTGQEVFPNKFPEHPTDFPSLISETKIEKGAGRYNYVVRENGDLVIGRKFNSPGGGHIDIANGKPVVAAGEVKIVQGEIKYIDNTSGHYEPSGPSTQRAAEDAFARIGLDSKGKYIEKHWVDDPKLKGGGSWRPK